LAADTEDQMATLGVWIKQRIVFSISVKKKYDVVIVTLK
jgi:hypothetical protein